MFGLHRMLLASAVYSFVFLALRYAMRLSASMRFCTSGAMPMMLPPSIASKYDRRRSVEGKRTAVNGAKPIVPRLNLVVWRQSW